MCDLVNASLSMFADLLGLDAHTRKWIAKKPQVLRNVYHSKAHCRLTLDGVHSDSHKTRYGT